mgnify:CR=1 FL=1|jgi:transcriptional regulator with XRE-family HTH domain
MIHSFIKNSPLKLIEVADYMGIESSSLSKILKGGTYMSYKNYDKLYNFLETHHAIAPRRNNVVAYPSGTSKGTFDIFINDTFAVTMAFYNEFDLLNFLNENDNRLTIIKNFIICQEDIKFKNKVRCKGRKSN